MTTCENFMPKMDQYNHYNNINNIGYNNISSNINNMTNERNDRNDRNDRNERNDRNSNKNLDYIYKLENLYGDFVNQNRYNVQKFPSYYNQQIEKENVIEMNQSYYSNNQNLVGGANPKTKIKPVVAPPTHDWEHWRANDFAFPNSVNDRSVQDYYSSGYYIDQDVQCSNLNTKIKENNYNLVNSNDSNGRRNMIKNNFNFNRNSNILREDYENTSYSFNKSSSNYLPISGKQDANSDEIKCTNCSSGSSSSENANPEENGDSEDKEDKIKSMMRYTGDLIDSRSYDITNLEYNLPSNYPSTNCQRRTDLKEINDQVFTSTIIPGIYYKNQIIEPISSNIGISFTQQVPPRKVSYDQYGNKIYTGMDPRNYTPIDNNDKQKIDVPSNYDIYDPRSNGYGTSYRSYIDKLTGQPRFYYDDINAIRRPNYIARSEIDFLDKADTYGPIKSDEEEIDVNKHVRQNVESAYLDNTIDFRTDMMTRLMRKRNAELWQTRMAPKAGMKK
jgi:hypothetical protein